VTKPGVMNGGITPMLVWTTWNVVLAVTGLPVVEADAVRE